MASSGESLSRKRLGEILINEGVVTQAEIDEALVEQKEQGGFLGRILIEAGYLSEDALISVLVKQCRIPHISLTDYEIDTQVVDLVPFEICREHKILPIDKLGSFLTLAMIDPLDIEALDEVSRLTSLRIKPLLCSWFDFEEVFSKLFRDQLSKEKETKTADPLPFEFDGLRNKSDQSESSTDPNSDVMTILSQLPVSSQVVETVEVEGGSITFTEELDSGALPSLAPESGLTESLVALRKQKRRGATESTSTETILDFEEPSPALTFETFVPSPAIAFSVAVCRAVADSPGPKYNPLYIYGGTGVGKTHLLCAIGNAVKLKFTNKEICYLPALEFGRKLMEAIQCHELKSFRENYAKKFLFVMDDIQHLMGRDRVQEEFYNIFNELYGSQRQIVVAADQAPDALVGLEKGLRSRFHGGIITCLEPPDIETRLAILESKKDDRAEQVPHEVLLFLASQIPEDVRKLEGAMKKLTAYASLVRQRVTIGLAKEVLKHLFETEV